MRGHPMLKPAKTFEDLPERVHESLRRSYSVIPELAHDEEFKQRIVDAYNEGYIRSIAKNN
jgi:hypothetical protein